jgi:hypothetical protein
MLRQMAKEGLGTGEAQLEAGWQDQDPAEWDRKGPWGGGSDPDAADNSWNTAAKRQGDEQRQRDWNWAHIDIAERALPRPEQECGFWWREIPLWPAECSIPKADPLYWALPARLQRACAGWCKARAWARTEKVLTFLAWRELYAAEGNLVWACRLRWKPGDPDWILTVQEPFIDPDWRAWWTPAIKRGTRFPHGPVQQSPPGDRPLAAITWACYQDDQPAGLPTYLLPRLTILVRTDILKAKDNFPADHPVWKSEEVPAPGRRKVRGGQERERVARQALDPAVR